ncbi:MAG: HD domain-containing protein [Nanoarchaeota archaeon]|nr:HD domain-containing protein [Nanoarchaeota archaeon]MBU1030633.1 HD domain-containing protein [Nanoarchaeota archaeon]MBU1849365.1 HD domain-containing protein [Nanoarchaeota archaeon]
MIITDRVYGETIISEDVLIGLINSNPLQRLKGINQAGASQFTIPGKTVTRYEHSIGVMILLRILGAPVEEQITGLLHDVPHTAFSHVIDFVFPNKNHEFHEKFQEHIINNSEIPEILKKHGFSLERILDEKNFPLLEKNIPDLCTDRVDYFLRDMTATNYCSKERIKKYLNNLIVKDNEIICKEKNTTKRFAEDYLVMDESNWSHPLEVTLYNLLADAIRIGVEKSILTQEDLFKDDQYVYSKLQNSKNNDIMRKLKMINTNLTIKDDMNDYDFYTKNKLRYIDPKFLDENKKIRTVSEISPKFKKTIEKHNNWINKGFYIKIVSW